jgi:hypothetical protein
MNRDFNLFEENQVWLLTTGKFVLITDVDPVTRINSSETDRRIHCKVGRAYKKGEQFKVKNQYTVVFENEPTESSIIIDCNDSETLTISQMRKCAATLIGKLNEDALKRYKRALSEYLDSID